MYVFTKEPHVPIIRPREMGGVKLSTIFQLLPIYKDNIANIV